MRLYLKTIVTLVKPTGKKGQGFHLGNYVSIIKPIKNFLSTNCKVYLGLADGHALNDVPDSSVLYANSEKMIKTLISFFYDDILNEKIIIYRQSAIAETFELAFILSQFCSKGNMNRMHGYKSCVEYNITNNRDTDFDINMGLFFYPILMAADILQFDCSIVPVGKDQVQHIEVAQEISRIANNFFNKEVLISPSAHLHSSSVLIGCDGRKMSKSYNNTIQILEESSKLKKKIFSISTNNKNIGEPKYQDESNVTAIFKELVTEDEYEHLLVKMKAGIGWGDVKSTLFNKVLDIQAPVLNIYNTLSKDDIQNIFNKCEAHVKQVVKTKIYAVKKELGLYV